VELQELFQNKSLGHKQIYLLNEMLKTQNEHVIPLSAKKTEKGQLSLKKSIAKSKAAFASKHSTA